jgi:hypothetical protein
VIFSASPKVWRMPGCRRRALQSTKSFGRAPATQFGRAFAQRAHASQSLFTLRQTQLTVSLPTAPPNGAASVRRTRRVLMPAR